LPGGAVGLDAELQVFTHKNGKAIPHGKKLQSFIVISMAEDKRTKRKNQGGDHEGYQQGSPNCPENGLMNVV
jgi:hypothetical protein